VIVRSLWGGEQARVMVVVLCLMVCDALHSRVRAGAEKLHHDSTGFVAFETTQRSSGQEKNRVSTMGAERNQ
jgi:hypothetical protein